MLFSRIRNLEERVCALENNLLDLENFLLNDKEAEAIIDINNRIKELQEKYKSKLKIYLNYLENGNCYIGTKTENVLLETFTDEHIIKKFNEGEVSQLHNYVFNYLEQDIILDLLKRKLIKIIDY